MRLLTPPRILANAAAIMAVCASVMATSIEPFSVDQEIARARDLAFRGAFEDSVGHWKQAITIAQKTNDAAVQTDAQYGLASAYEAMGNVRLAAETLRESETLAANDTARLARIKSALGALYIFSEAPVEDHSQHTEHQDNPAEALLKESIQLARESRDYRTESMARNNLGNFYGYRQDFGEASKQYESALNLAAKVRDDTLSSEISANYARTALSAGNYGDAVHWCEVVLEKTANLPASHNNAYQLLAAGRMFEEFFRLAPEHDNKFRLRAYQAFEKAAAVAEKIGDKRAVSFAYGYQGELYEEEKKYDEALGLTRKAVLLAQEEKSPDTLYRWQWQTGRLLHGLRDNEAAIAAYRRAIETLQSIRHDVALRYGNPNAHSSFRQVAGDLYFQLADLLLQRADSARNSAELNRWLLEARDAAELLKSAELEDYFQDQCVNLLKSKITKVETISKTAAIVYIIPLPDRTEMLVSLPSGLQRIKSTATNRQLDVVAHLFRANLEKRTTYEYLDQAKQLYDWLIKPLEPALAHSGIDTLVFVPDGALRGIPMAALHDGEKYLIQKYAVAITPGLTLMEPSPFTRDKIAVIASGLSVGVQGFAPLKYVPEEIGSLKKMFGGTELMNQQFVKPNLEKEISQEDYAIVHIASHGHFDADAKKSFLLTYEGKLTLDDLEQLIRPSNLREKPVELLTLSACQTAAGDDRAALGLAGIAIKAGARSAFATLWFVNDESSTLLVSDFYRQLHDHSDFSKARALQVAQLKLQSDARYAHPCYWAPYLIIGNWL